MKKVRKVFVGILALTIGVFTLVSCNKSDPTPLYAVVDVFVQDIKTDDGVKYGIFVYATANYEIKSATVTGPGTGGEVYQLTASSNKQQFVFIPATADYTSEFPAVGNYSFEITSVNDEQLTGIDAVGAEKLAPILIKTATFTDHLLKTSWDNLTGADAYVVNFYSADKSKFIFSSNYLASDLVEFEFGSTTSGWASGESPVANTSYVLELLGVRAEAGATSDQGNNLQFITLDSKTITWQ
ncbi:MAG TPA: hypothetical protein VFC65_20920 [Prolixibacteraceae bacterium]|nr:hypothetical protein [Prolixibacteraceae bacterium]